MKKILSSLPAKLALAVIVGIILGQILSFELMEFIVTLKYILNQMIMFCVPLIIIGFIAPSITRLGNNASKILGIAVGSAYISSIGAAFFSLIAGYLLIPQLNIITEVEGTKELPAMVFQLDIPQIMPVMSALVFSLFVGLAATWVKAEVITGVLEEFQEMVLSLVKKIVIPILPLFICLTFTTLSFEGIITNQVPVFLKVILIVIVGHYIWMAVLYAIAGLYTGENPFQIIKNYGEAYLTAIGTMSSAATLAVALRCAKKSEPPLRDDMVNFGIPLFANIHLCGSVLTEVFFVMTVSKILYGNLPSLPDMILFCLLLGVFAIGAPGVPGGTVMASLGLISGVLGFDETGIALMLTIFALQDSFGTACNVTGDGALTLILSGYMKKREAKQDGEKGFL